MRIIKLIQERSQVLSEINSKGSAIDVYSSMGTDMKFSIKGRQAVADTGIIIHSGEFGNLPGGEAYVAPIEGSASGIIVFDSMLAGIGILNNPIKAYITNGLLTRAEGGEEASRLIDMLHEIGDDNAYNLAEFGIGTNDKAIITGKFLEDEKAIGTIHFALGNNISFGGNVNVPIHLDGLVQKPTVIVDGQIIMEEGQFKIF